MTTIEELKNLLRFALEHLSYTQHVEDGDEDYEYCTYCGKAEYDHDSDCQAVLWEKRVRKILAESE
jgi:hypothetical protein